MIISGPGIAAGRNVYNLTSLLDVYPTLVAMANQPTRNSNGENKSVAPLASLDSSLDGYSLFPLMQSAGSGYTSAYPRDRAVVSQYHSNMGNTGSFMLRQGPWKYIAFGHGLPEIFNATSYSPQLFNVDEDPQELHDKSKLLPDVVSELDRLLQMVVDYQSVDREAKANDQALYRSYFSEKFGEGELRQRFEQVYQGFDDADFEKVKRWAKMTP